MIFKTDLLVFQPRSEDVAVMILIAKNKDLIEVTFVYKLMLQTDMFLPLN